MPLLPFREDLTGRRRSTLLFFFIAALLSAGAISLDRKIPSFRTVLFALAVASAGVAILLLLHFLRANDEREQQINYRALMFAFMGTLVFSTAIGFLQSFGFHPLSWLGIPALMIILWSIGLILYSWRYR
jgi:heme/copper-type cytochrome/quinol oxidase subunit 4